MRQGTYGPYRLIPPSGTVLDSLSDAPGSPVSSWFRRRTVAWCAGRPCDDSRLGLHETPLFSGVVVMRLFTHPRKNPEERGAGQAEDVHNALSGPVSCFGKREELRALTDRSAVVQCGIRQGGSGMKKYIAVIAAAALGLLVGSCVPVADSKQTTGRSDVVRIDVNGVPCVVAEAIEAVAISCDWSRFD